MKESGNQRKNGMLQISGWDAFQFALMIRRFIGFLANIITILFTVILCIGRCQRTVAMPAFYNTAQWMDLLAVLSSLSGVKAHHLLNFFPLVTGNDRFVFTFIIYIVMFGVSGINRIGKNTVNRAGIPFLCFMEPAGADGSPLSGLQSQGVYFRYCLLQRAKSHILFKDEFYNFCFFFNNEKFLCYRV